MERRIMLLALLPMLIILGVDGLDFRASGGSGANSRGYDSHIEADDDVDVSGHFSLRECSLAGNFEFKGAGALNAYETKTNNEGDSVSLAADGFLLPGNVYSTSWSGEDKSEPIIGTQLLTGTGSNINCVAKATNRYGLEAKVAAEVGRGSIDIQQSGNAFKNSADAWQKINKASGENIALYAETSDRSGKNMAYSSVKVGSGFLQDYRSEAEATLLEDGSIDLYAIHGAFNIDDKEENPIGRISGDRIRSEGLTFNQKGLTALYGVTIIDGSVEGRFDWGTETKSNGWVIAVPLETPAAWGGYPEGNIKISAFKIWSESAALDGKKIVSKDWAYAKWVSANDWSNGYGFAEPGEAKKI